MKLGDNILKLRKQKGLSQEQLGEQVNVTRQTISNWELGETNPNPEQLKLLSKVLNISIDELLDNEVREVLMNKVSNTEKLAGIIIKILKVLGILAIIYFVFFLFAIIGLSIYAANKKEHVKTQATTVCRMDDKSYEIEIDSNHQIQCENCSEGLLKELKKNANDKDIDQSMKQIEQYIINHNGSCE